MDVEHRAVMVLVKAVPFMYSPREGFTRSRTGHRAPERKRGERRGRG